jgi:hypothetical protein
MKLRHIAYYYSDQQANLPVRAVRKKDPSIETKTYGYYTMCMLSARRNIVKRSDSYIFFFTNWKGGRIFTGYYELDEYIPRANGIDQSFALRAKKIHFIRNGIPLVGKRWSKITVESIKKDFIDAYGPRGYKQIDTIITVRLKELLDAKENIVQEYIRELDRLKDENLSLSGFKDPCQERKDGFTNEDINSKLSDCPPLLAL